ncbi:MAG: DUF4446 family protein [Nocardioides sp.]|uniref:DUF4446 family protein n=1 Tax=Nocardioides sp. TaxID=35761 RepID=UPI0039E70CFB
MVVLALLSLVVALLALGLAAVAWRDLRSQRRRLADQSVPEDVLGLRQEVAALRAEGRDALRHFAVVRYDAFDDLGGQLSWSVALLDEAGNGAVLTSIHGRSDARSYAKSVTGWRSAQQLSPQEESAIEQARPRGDR